MLSDQGVYSFSSEADIYNALMTDKDTNTMNRGFLQTVASVHANQAMREFSLLGSLCEKFSIGVLKSIEVRMALKKCATKWNESSSSSSSSSSKFSSSSSSSSQSSCSATSDTCLAASTFGDAKSILSHLQMRNKKDEALTQETLEAIANHFANKTISSLNFDSEIASLGIVGFIDAMCIAFYLEDYIFKRNFDYLGHRTSEDLQALKETREGRFGSFLNFLSGIKD